MANICLAFLEPTISKWMHETMDAEEWQQVMTKIMITITIMIMRVELMMMCLLNIFRL